MSRKDIIINDLKKEIKKLERQVELYKTPKMKTFKIKTTDNEEYELKAVYADYFTTGVVAFKMENGMTIAVVLNAKSVIENTEEEK